MAINLRNESNIFSTYVFESAIKLIDNRIWTIDKIDFLTWKKNFKTNEEKYLAACLVDSLVYRTNAHIISSFKSLFCQHLPSLVRFRKLLCTDNPIEKLIKQQNSIKIVTANNDNEYGKSSHHLANILKKYFEVHQSNIIAPSDVSDFYENGTMLFIFTDDFLGTGDQFINGIRSSIYENICDKVFVYCPLIAHEIGIEAIQSAYPTILINPIETIKKDYCFFEKYFSDKLNTPIEAKDFYANFLNEKGFANNLFGHGNLGVSVAFDYTIPDNSLLAFWGLEEHTRTTYHRLFKR